MMELQTADGMKAQRDMSPTSGMEFIWGHERCFWRPNYFEPSIFKTGSFMPLLYPSNMAKIVGVYVYVYIYVCAYACVGGWMRERKRIEIQI